MVAELEAKVAYDEPVIPGRLWVYTNFDCNLSCSYCLSSSSPAAARRELPFSDYRQLIDEAAGAGFGEVFLTGGEPFILPDIYERIEYAARSLSLTILTNAILLHGSRLERLLAPAYQPLFLIDRSERFGNEMGVIWLPGQDSNLRHAD